MVRAWIRRAAAARCPGSFVQPSAIEPGPTGGGGALPGFGDQRNFELLVEAGFTPEQAIQICSTNGAKVLGITDKAGPIQVGNRADLVVAKGDVVRTPGDIANTVTVFKDGIGYDSAKLIASAKGLVGIR